MSCIPSTNPRVQPSTCVAMVLALSHERWNLLEVCVDELNTAIRQFRFRCLQCWRRLEIVQSQLWPGQGEALGRGRTQWDNRPHRICLYKQLIRQKWAFTLIILRFRGRLSHKGKLIGVILNSVSSSRDCQS